MTNEMRPQVVQRTLTSGEVAIILGYIHRHGKHEGQPDRYKVYKMARAGVIPAAINADNLPCIDWRWSPAVIDAYVAGEWQAIPTPKPTPLRGRRAS